MSDGGSDDSSDSDLEFGVRNSGEANPSSSSSGTTSNNIKSEVEKEDGEFHKVVNDDDDDDDDDEKEIITGTSVSSSKKKTMDNSALFDDDDESDNSDDDEEEFDDKDMVVGTSKKLDTTSTNTTQASSSYQTTDFDSNTGTHQEIKKIKDEDTRNNDNNIPNTSSTGKEEVRQMDILDIAQPRYRNKGDNTTTTTTTTTTKDNKEQTDISFHITKLPNIVGINSEAFDPDTYDATMEEAEYKGYIHNMIRWRYRRDPDTGAYMRDDQHNKLIRESNARFVKWSDGSYTLHVGDQSFEVDNIGELTSTSTSTAATASGSSNGFLYLSQKATMANNDDNHDNNHENNNNSTVLECMGPIRSKMIARPSSLQSDAHKNLTLAVRQRNMKKARIAEYVTHVDPEKEKLARIKNKEDFNKQQQQQQQSNKRRTNSIGNNRRRINRYADEDDEHYDNVNLGNLKRRTYEDDDVNYDYGRDDSDESDDWYQRKKERTKPKKQNTSRYSSDEDDYIDNKRTKNNPTTKGNDNDSSGQEEEFMADSDDEEEAVIRKGSTKKRSHAAVFDDDDD